MLDQAVMAEIAESHFSPVVSRQFGPDGSQALREILEFLRHKLFRYVIPDLYQGQITVFKAIENATPLPILGSTVLTDFSQLSQEITTDFTLQILSPGQARFWRHASTDVNDLSRGAIVYVYRDRSDRFIAKGEVGVIPNPDRQHASVFAIPTFDNLRDAIMFYSARRARNSACAILSGAWFERARLFFATAPEKPEAIMRTSLSEFLKGHLRGDVDVHPEHKVNELEPVDIRVEWQFSKSQALIEIKWMGKSKNSAGRITANHGADRARKGAKRLAEYLEEEKRQTPTNLQRGYLVVIDARRWMLKPTDTTINSSRGLHYQYEEIPFDPDYHSQRDDFEEPIRMFIAPRLDV